MGSEEQLRHENAELRAREARHREERQQQLELSRRLREHASRLCAALREPAVRGVAAVLAEAAEVSAQALDVARASVWLLDAGRQVLERRHLHERGVAPAIPPGEVGGHVRAPATELLAADDATADPRLHELRAYCAGHGIGALLDVPIVAGGELIGAICHEHVGGARAWRDAEVDFAASLGSLVALAIEAERRLEAERRHRQPDEVELAQQRKFESLGRMAASVAHDFSNALTVISLSLAHGNRDGEISVAMGYAHELVSSLMSYARREPIAAVDVDVDAAIDQLSPVLATAVGRDLRLDVDLRAAGSRVRIAPTELRQLVVNMVTNAGEATRGHGRTVSVSTDAIAGEAPGRWVDLRIADDGRGMDDATRARAFDPFFTTKPPGEGTGIGLATCRSIVSRAGGTITVDSTPGLGTAFRILLPVSGRSAEIAVPRAPIVRPVFGYRVLLVEDVRMVADLVGEVLRNAGHDVVVVGSIAAALAELARARFDVVVADLRLPDGRGEEVIAAARARDPEAAIVVASGEAAALDGVDEVLVKPFTTDELKAGILRAVERRRGAE